MDLILFLIVLGPSLIVGGLVGYIIRKNVSEKSIGNAEQKAKNLILDAENKAEVIRKEMMADTKDEVQKMRDVWETEIKERRQEIHRSEKRLLQKEESIDKKLGNIERKEENIARKEQKTAERERELQSIIDKQTNELEKVSQLSQDEARDILLNNTKEQIRPETSLLIKEMVSKAREDADKEAKEIIISAIERCSSDYIAETTVSVVNLPNDDMKGRIIGREGRNIRAVETMTGVDFIIDDTPEAVILSSHDPIRREIARISLEKLIVDGRIHPARIEEVVKNAENDVNKKIKEDGDQAVFELGIHNLHPELIRLLGSMRYRTSYGQNVLKHSIEVAHLAGLMASQLGLNVKVAKRAGLLHDIGKALTHEIEDTHVNIGIDLLRRYKESDAVINGMASHHGDCEHKSMEAVLVTAADTLSAARPGARRDTIETYIKRLQKLEEIANTTVGVEKSYAIQAGREIRIIAKPEVVKENELELLAREITEKIQSELEYPGQIKVNVIRETRAVDYAK